MVFQWTWEFHGSFMNPTGSTRRQLPSSVDASPLWNACFGHLSCETRTGRSIKWRSDLRKKIHKIHNIHDIYIYNMFKYYTLHFKYMHLGANAHVLFLNVHEHDNFTCYFETLSDYVKLILYYVRFMDKD